MQIEFLITSRKTSFFSCTSQAKECRRYHVWLVYNVSMEHAEEFADLIRDSISREVSVPRFERLRIYAGRKPGEAPTFPFEACPKNSFNSKSNTFNAIGFGISFHIEKDETLMAALKGWAC